MLIRERCRHKGNTQSDLPNFVERDAEVSAVRNNQDLNNEMEVTVEERRDEENAGLKRKIDEMFMSEGEMEEDADAFKVVCDAPEYGWSLTNPCDVDMGNSVDILDSSSACIAKIDKYDKKPNVVRDMVIKYFKSKGLDGRVEKLKAQEPKRLQLAWRDSTAVFDYGVITMRHMETYTGHTLKQWECGLKKGDEKVVNALRTTLTYA
ncbi:unnamed protein product [Cuscuta campestris]|uniref:Uncharacterized protein n=1 Tax=Cuscuta campestris TaxID=132261 RepID=A0A484N037_9ASTE|nr:unnamed protein product [Cuscuta campestris]